MLICLTGLHGAGKSYFSELIPLEFGFKIFSKKKELSRIYKLKTGKDNWQDWYQKEYSKDPRRITEFILSGIRNDDNTILDAIHSPIEWDIIKEKFPDACLAEVVTPESIRNQRITTLDMEKDKKRISYWHSNNECLLTKVDWTFNGAASKDLNENSFQEFINYIKMRDIQDKNQSLELNL